MTAWIEVLTALTSGPDVPLRGTVREIGAAARADGFVAIGSSPMLVVADDGCRVWRHGDRLRVEHEDGRPIFVTDGIHAWDFTADLQRPRVGPPDRVHYLGPTQFLLRRKAAEWAGDDFARPAGPVEEVEFVGRACWTVELAPPPRKPEPLRIWVDKESGQMLGYRSEAAGFGAQFVDLVVGEPIADARFVWGGPVVTPEQHQQILQDRFAAVKRVQTDWFAETVTAAPILARVPIDFTPDAVPFRDPDSGAFDAMNEHTMLSRRPRSQEGWTPRWGVAHFIWSTPRWDWAAAALDADLDDEAIRQLQHVLHPDEPIARQRRIVPPGRGRVG
ncbi:hypothetical protein [Nocardia sp. NPDC050413]|uniref:hypothetical protein n=1 Tax=Nocardia sp. NPDC050413 TaxID=3155784 RepID=UPI0033DFA4FD